MPDTYISSAEGPAYLSRYLKEFELVRRFERADSNDSGKDPSPPAQALQSALNENQR